MSKLLHLIASPRGVDSKSTKIALARIDAMRMQNAALNVDTIDLWNEPLPEFEGNSAAAKLTFFGVGTLEGQALTAWNRITEIANRFKAADQYLFSIPMWNSGIPYRLKLYIDIITQPGLLFGFDPAKGYSGLLQNKTATLVCTSGVFAPGAPAAFGLDYQSTYMDWWLRFIGVTNIDVIRFQPSLLNSDPVKGLADAIVLAQKLSG